MIYRTIFFAFVTLCPVIILADNASKSVIDVGIYYETLCGDSVNFITKKLVPAYPALKNHLNITFVPYGKAQHERTSSGSWIFTCQHGNIECLGNKAQACALKAIETNEDAQNQQLHSVNLVGCVMGASYNNVTVENCARSVNLKEETVSEITKCKNDDNVADNLLVAQGEKTKSLEPPLFFVPTITINNKMLSSDEQNLIRNDFEQYIWCKALTGIEKKPVICTV